MKRRQEHKRSMQGPDTDAQDQPPPFFHIRLATHGRSIQLGQKAKYSLRAHRVRFASESGLKSDIAGGPFHAKLGSGEQLLFIIPQRLSRTLLTRYPSQTPAPYRCPRVA